MLKVEKEYLEEYGDVPINEEDRYQALLKEVNLKRQKTTVSDTLRRIMHIPWKKLSYVIYLVPKATPRPRSGRNGVFYVKGAKDNHKIFEQFMIGQDIDIITTPTKFSCKCYFPIPKSMNGVEKVVAELGYIRPTSKPDWDNVAKAYCDMIQDLLLYDDALIVDGRLEKYYSTKPRVEVVLEYMADYDSMYNKKKIEKKGLI